MRRRARAPDYQSLQRDLALTEQGGDQRCGGESGKHRGRGRKACSVRRQTLAEEAWRLLDRTGQDLPARPRFTNSARMHETGIGGSRRDVDVSLQHENMEPDGKHRQEAQETRTPLRPTGPETSRTPHVVILLRFGDAAQAHTNEALAVFRSAKSSDPPKSANFFSSLWINGA